MDAKQWFYSLPGIHEAPKPAPTSDVYTIARTLEVDRWDGVKSKWVTVPLRLNEQTMTYEEVSNG